MEDSPYHYNERHWMKNAKRDFCRNRHHMINRCKGGTNHKWNTLRLKKHREILLHLLFGNSDFVQVLHTLIRWNREKGTKGHYDQYIRWVQREIRAKEVQKQREQEAQRWCTRKVG